MSYSLGLYRFVDGELAESDADIVRTVLTPYEAAPATVSADGMEYWIRAADGSETEVSLCDKLIVIERPQVGDVWKVIIELADQLGMGILIPDGAFLCREEMRAHLPEGMENCTVLVPEITLGIFEEAAGPFKHPLTSHST
ncbi:hypothetical protein AB0I49_13165 [Streptomyces sp. NPDC050617]|uniref:hypothetical protein n=1 Tax=Streptomyces sp. NPDC050617 TaxID=3154628 RepID=UPI00341BB39C